MFFRNMNLLRPKTSKHTPVTFAELFFDLIFVFTIIQISTTFAYSFDVYWFIQILLITLSMWIVWIYTTWHLNWLNPEKLPVRILLYMMMLAWLFLSTSIPEVFWDRWLFFATAYILIQVWRTLFITLATKNRRKRLHSSMFLIFIWIVISSVFWILGWFSEGINRLIFWWIAVFIELIWPTVWFYVPYVWKTWPKDWEISGAHMAERCGLFIIICLGETILVNWWTFSDLTWNFHNTFMFILIFLITISMWAIYFNFWHSEWTQQIEKSDNPWKIGLWAYHFAHIPLVLWIIFSAVWAKFLLKYPTWYLEDWTILAFLWWTLLFLMWSFLFKKLTTNRVYLSHIIWFFLVWILYIFSNFISPMIFIIWVLLIHLIVILFEYKKDRLFI